MPRRTTTAAVPGGPAAAGARARSQRRPHNPPGPPPTTQSGSSAPPPSHYCGPRADARPTGRGSGLAGAPTHPPQPEKKERASAVDSSWDCPSTTHAAPQNERELLSTFTPGRVQAARGGGPRPFPRLPTVPARAHSPCSSAPTTATAVTAPAPLEPRGKKGAGAGGGRHATTTASRRL